MKITTVQFDLADGARKFAQRLAHQARLQPHVAESPISPSSSALGHERRDGIDDQITSRAPERTNVSVISSACSPVSG
jgi:hypothetical protein